MKTPIRRVKCDEARPHCRRCITFEVKCDGYATPKCQSSNLVDDRTGQTPRRKQGPDPLASSQLTTSLFDAEEHQYFHYFCNSTVAELSGYFENEFWGRLILQTCHHEPAVRKAVVAIAALGKTKEEAQIQAPRSPAPVDLARAKRHHQFALRRYDAAVKLMRCELNNAGGHQVRRALVWSLLIYCFETYHGDHETALEHAQAGLKLWLECLEQQHPEMASPGQDQRKSSELGLTSPAPWIVEDEISQAYTRLDCEVMTYSDTRPRSSHQKLRSIGMADVRDMPTKFSTLREARRYWWLVESRAMHYIASSYERTDGPKQGHEPHSIFRSAEEISENHRLEKDRRKNDIHRWLAAAEPILERSRSEKESADRMGIIALIVHSKFRLVGLGVHVTQCREMAYDEHSEMLTETLELLRVNVDEWQRTNRQQNSRYTPDSGIVINLFRCAMKCRVPKVRREAIALLKRVRCREGFWDSELCARAATWVMNTEEKGLQGDFVPLEWRISVTSLTCLMSCWEQESKQKQGTLEIKLAQTHCSSPLFSHTHEPVKRNS
ncbi:hypothetical protein BP6252_06598 [Coleophoma cylindrospora]|uniref:Zn(2)-C6 fungal-type domain-containing protein n=1 Tax=Coleophoma cylindrospora TaxID=1849047 RepID=A0A3D8RNC9_9HELO|nr:hypothetical protein BP6252_06598 [Coleophoma cylindrospora]